MFVLTELQDTVEIRVAASDRNQAILEKLSTKYTNRTFEALGTALFVSKIIEILEYEIQSEILIVSVIFEVVFNRFYSEEIVQARIKKQDEEKIIAEDALGVEYEIVAADMFENCELENEGNSPTWFWNYKGNKLPIVTSEQVRIRTRAYRFKDRLCEASMNEQGLGPVCWWD